MKKFIYVVYATVIVFMSIFPLNAFALHFDSRQVDLEWSNAPENTAYIDILVKMNTDDEDYVDFTSPPEKLIETYIDENGTTQYKYEDLSIDKNSGIAGLNDNGWVSLSLHNKYSDSITIKNTYQAYFYIKYISSEENEDIKSISKKYGSFKCAYVDENGNVLGITGKSKKSYSMSEPYAIIADSDDVNFRIFDMPPFVNMILIALIYGVPILLFLTVSYLLYLFIVHKVRKSRLHYGDDLNEREKD
ncbi:MAG: hypothetical protein K2N27_06340 [Ruminococcus sp.]|nr:hypothetical protein [Ruminococcus sp.]